MDIYNYLKNKSVKELQDIYVYANEYQKNIIKKCIEEKTIINKQEYFNNNNIKFHENLNKFEDIMRNDQSNNKFQDRININLKNKENCNFNNDNNLGKRKNF
jgi:hypothetical protein